MQVQRQEEESQTTIKNTMPQNTTQILSVVWLSSISCTVVVIMQEVRVVRVISSAGIGVKRCFIADVF